MNGKYVPFADIGTSKSSSRPEALKGGHVIGCIERSIT